MRATKPDAWNFVHDNFCGEWFDGAPLGNGDLGALLLPHHKRITFALAKSDVWDERCDDGTGRRRSFRIAEGFAEVRSLIERQRWDEIERRFEERNQQWRGKFCLRPAGSLVLSTDRFEKEIELLDFGYRLDLQRALGSAWSSTRVRRQTTEALVSVDHQVLAVRFRHDMDWKQGNPPRSMTFGMDTSLNVNPKDPETRVESGVERGVLWTRVRGYHEVDYTIAVRVEGIWTTRCDQGLTVTAKDKADFVIYVAVGSRIEAIRRVRAAGRTGYARIMGDHLRWWKTFWNVSQVRIPDENLLRQYHFGLYLLGSSSRKGFLMPGLQGLWSTKPEGSGWNDYTNDLNIQMNYWPIYVSNHLELGWPYYDTVRGWLPETRKFTQEYWGCRGVQFSCCASPTGIIPPGYLTTIHWAGHAAFVAQNFWSHYEFSRDKEFLREVAFPMLKECALFYLDFLKKDQRGLYEIWPSNTPEASEGSYEAWGKNPSMDVALLRLLFRAVIESCQTLGGDAELTAQCRERLDHLPSYPTSHGWLIEMESKEFQYSHRHPGMLTPIYPCADLAGKTARKSIDRFIAKGRWLWCGFSPVWVAGACARVGRGVQAHDLLREFMEVYTTRQGGFHLNYDYAGTGRGMSGPKCFTNEADSGFSAALLEMLLQSHDDVIHVFPAVPDDWRDVSFENLRARGAFLVSAVQRGGAVQEIRIRSERGGPVRVLSPWHEKAKVTSQGKRIVVQTSGSTLRWDTMSNTLYTITR